MGRVKRPAQRIIVIVLALLLVVPIGVVGLGQLISPGPEESEPTVEPSVQSTQDNRPTVDPADQPARPELDKPAEPAAMQEQTAEGAEATLTYMLESYTYMMSTGDTSVWENSVDPNCQVCTSFLDNAQLLDDQGGYLVDGEFSVEGTSFEGTGDPPATGTVTVDFAQEASILVEDPERQPYQLEAVTGQLQASMAWDGERWRVNDMSLAPDEAAASDGGGAGNGGAIPGG